MVTIEGTPCLWGEAVSPTLAPNRIPVLSQSHCLIPKDEVTSDPPAPAGKRQSFPGQFAAPAPLKGQISRQRNSL